MNQSWLKCQKRLICFAFFSVFFLALNFSFAFAAELYINILAVNSTDQVKEKKLKQYLPKELSADDIVDIAGLKMDYDVSEGAYFVYGSVTLQPKETKTFKVRVKDVWLVEEKEVDDIKDQIQQSLNRIQNTEYADIGKIKKESLMKRLDYIVDQQTNFKDSIEKRIDRFRIYDKELQEVRENALSVKYWRSKPSMDENTKIVNFTVNVENTSKETKKTSEDQKHYLPREVKPEDIVDLQGFDIHYDPVRGQSYLTKIEEISPGQIKKYNIGVIDSWFVPPVDIENLKDRTRKTFKLLEKTEYAESAKYLVASIKEGVDKIEASQAIERNITEHISAYRTNQKLFAKAKRDVEALEALLEAVRESLERSPLKNVLQKIRSIKSVADIAQTIFGHKPSINNAWKIITGVVIFVAIITFLHFMIWGKRSREAKINQKKDNKQTEQKV